MRKYNYRPKYQYALPNIQWRYFLWKQGLNLKSSIIENPIALHIVPCYKTPELHPHMIEIIETN